MKSPRKKGAEESLPESSSSSVAEFVKRMAVNGLGALLVSEEGLRRAVEQRKIPEGALSQLRHQAERARADLARILSAEVQNVLRSDWLKEALQEALGGMTLEVRAEVKLVPKKPTPQGKASDGGGEHPGMKLRVRRRSPAPPK